MSNGAVLIPAVVAIQVDVDGRDAVRHLGAERDGAAPPGFVGQEVELEFRLRGVLREDRRGGEQDGKAKKTTDVHDLFPVVHIMAVSPSVCNAASGVASRVVRRATVYFMRVT